LNKWRNNFLISEVGFSISDLYKGWSIDWPFSVCHCEEERRGNRELFSLRLPRYARNDNWLETKKAYQLVSLFCFVMLD